MTAADSKAFEASVRDLLSLSGATTSEIRLIYKKVDLLLQGHRFGRLWRTAVECKAHSRPLHLSETAAIINDYRPLIDGRAIEEVLVVTREGLTPDSAALVEVEPAFAHLTYSELSNEILDLSTYIRGLIGGYRDSRDGIAHYYVPAKSMEKGDLLAFLNRWVKSGKQPVAILGAYGTGKSTFALRFAAYLAEAAAAAADERRPVLIRLSDISAEQTLEGLLGRTLGVTNAIPNYSFDRFMSLNRAGRFVVILDGFDEMKRTLSWEEFRHNLDQLNRLVSGSARVVLLGRPTAFLNDNEYDLALHGVQRFSGREMRLPDWPDYQTVTMAPFTPPQVADFLDRYLRWTAERRDDRPGRHARRSDKAEEAHQRKITAEIAHQVARVQAGHLKEIAKRPVQLKMLAEILPTYRGSLEKLDTTLLFDHFIDRIIARDASKLTRTRFSTKERRQFAADIAWWLWSEPAKVRIAPDEIPDDLIRDFVGPDDNPDAVRRDLVAACFLDRSHGGPLVFPHRAFQEFLVAERMLDLLHLGAIGVATVDQSLNHEVAAFMHGMTGAAQLDGFDQALSAHQGEMSLILARLWFSDDAKIERLTSLWKSRPTTLWYTQLLTWARLQQGGSAAAVKAVPADDLLRMLRGTRHSEKALLLWRCILTLANKKGDALLVEEATRALLEVGDRVPARSQRAGDIPLRNLGLGGSEYLRPSALVARVLKHAKFAGRKQMVDLRGTYAALEQSLRPVCWLKGAGAHDAMPSNPTAVREARLAGWVALYVSAGLKTGG